MVKKPVAVPVKKVAQEVSSDEDSSDEEEAVKVSPKSKSAPKKVNVQVFI